MRGPRRVISLVAATAAAVGALAACTADAVVGSKVIEPAGRGGTLTLLSAAAIPTLDPQRIGDPATGAMVGRTLHRTLTAYAPMAGEATQPSLVGDLATDTGEPSEDLKTWRFTLRPNLTWQDGSPLGCEDVKHGIARTFATDVITGGSTDALSALAIPRTPDGRSTFLGPWAQGDQAAAGQASFDQAVSCADRTISFVLAEPVADFNEMVTLAAFAPVKKDGDSGPDSGAASLSSGPYRLEGTWNAETGGLLVRNEKWRAESDPVRKANPDRIRITTGQEPGVIAATVLADDDTAKASVSLTPAPIALQQQVSSVEALRDRSLALPTGVIDYLAPNVTSPVLQSREARTALELSTRRSGYAVGLASPIGATPTASLIPDGLLARATTAVPVGEPDPTKARQILQQAGVAVPVPIRVAYREGPAADKAMSALVTGWREGGFDPTLVPIKDSYFGTISAPGATEQYDVFWSNWSPAWGSASTILPPLFDASLNLTEAGSGRDYGGWSSVDWNARVGQIASMPDRAAREKAWAEADDVLREDVAYIALAARSAVHLAGSDVRGLAAHPYGGGAIDLGVAGVN